MSHGANHGFYEPCWRPVYDEPIRRGMVIGFAGAAGSGKNTAARRLAELVSLPVREISFAAKMKEAAAALLGVSVADLDVWKNNPDRQVAVGTYVDGLGFVAHKETTQTIRAFLERLGTEAGRDIHGEDCWVELAMPLMGMYGSVLTVATDTRFPNEADQIHALGGVTVRVIGPDDETTGHPSRLPLECDYEIDNTIRDDGYESLDTQLVALLDAITPDGKRRMRADDGECLTCGAYTKPCPCEALS